MPTSTSSCGDAPTTPTAVPRLSGVSDDAPLVAITDPDGTNVPAAPLDDFARLDGLDPTLKLIAWSNNTGNQGESLSTGRLPAGTYYVQVYGANGEVNVEPAALQFKVKEAEDRPVCASNSIADWSGTFPSPPTIPVDANTLFLVNETRTEQLYPGQSDDLLAGVDRLTDYLADNPGLGVNPVVLPVDAYEACAMRTRTGTTRRAIRTPPTRSSERSTT